MSTHIFKSGFIPGTKLQCLEKSTKLRLILKHKNMKTLKQCGRFVVILVPLLCIVNISLICRKIVCFYIGKYQFKVEKGNKKYQNSIDERSTCLYCWLSEAKSLWRSKNPVCVYLLQIMKNNIPCFN